MIDSATHSNKTLFIQKRDGIKESVSFESDVMELVMFEHDVIVRLKNDRAYGSRNIFRVNENGEIVWQVQHPFEFRNIQSDSSAAFTYLGLRDGKIIGGSVDCFTYEIDFKTGKLSNPVFTK
ncbi:MAG TPA: hypothetical protein PKL97_07725 [Candidatus Omnitrophota bacterium]|nr:hypothetical protein [Candidatus Omnitrophota bacterium]